MRPSIVLDPEIVIANARAWREYCAPAAFFPVVKADAYGWGVDRVVPLLDRYADAFCVSDIEELRSLRKVTDTPAIVLGAVAHNDLKNVLRANALPTMQTLEDVRTGLAHGKVRLGVRPAVAWSGSTLEELRVFARELAGADVHVELWTHITDLARMNEQVALFEAARAMLLDAGVRIARTDVAGTFALTAGCRAGDAVRLGVGLFGATGGPQVAGVRCALRVQAPVIKWEEVPAGSRIGYGGTAFETEERVATARCGYSDGIPKTLEGTDDIVSVGMQYLTIRGRAAGANDSVAVIDHSTNLDRFAAACGRLPHEIVTALGNAAR